MRVDLSLSYGAWPHERASHALVVAQPGEQGATAERLRAAVARRPDLAEVALWTERLPLPADDPRARMYRERELRRGCPAGVAPLRAVVVNYADGASDLILTARRDVLGQGGLRWLAGLLVGRETSSCAPAEPLTRSGDDDGWGAVPQRLPTPPAWGLGDRRHPNTYGLVTVDLPTPPALPTAALALVLSRYDTAPVRFAVITASESGGLDEVSLHGGDLTGATPIRDLDPAGLDPAGFGPAVAPLARGAEVLAEPPAVALLVVDDDGYRPGATPPFPIALVWRRGSTRLSCWYERTYLCETIAEQFLRHLGAAAGAIAGGGDHDGDATVGAIALMTAEETGRVLAAGRTSPPEGNTLPATIHAAVLSCARARPGALAYRDEVGSLTYHQLDEAAGVMAGALRVAGVVPGARVGVCLSRGPELIVVLLAILRAGAAYVPMDVRHPPQRLRFTTLDAGIGLVVTDITEFPVIDGVTAVHPSHLRATGAPPPAAPPPFGAAGPDDTAYVIYTSGSTGRPKGVQVPHRSVMALLAATARDMHVNQDDVWTWFHSPAFDFAVWEIWGALTTGARLVGVSTDVSRSPDDFYDLLGREGVTVLNQTPSAFGALTRVDAARRMSTSDGRRASLSKTGQLALRLVVLGGETLDVASLREWSDGHPLTHCRLVNMFGITETTVHVTSHTIIDLDVVDRSRSVGRALPGWSVSVRDPEGRPVPFGVAGEVYVGGAGVADGYLNRTELTAERFVQDPYGAGRVYRSGDLGRLHPGGTLDHLGRLDSQVQLRGHRVELEEVRAVLLETGDVRAAAVVVGYAVPDDPDSARLDAYVVLDGPVGTRPTGNDVRRRLSGFLPEYMVPSTVTVLDALPLTVNGKVDVGRLPRPALGGPAIDPQPASETGARPAPAPEESADGEAPRQLRLTLRRVWTAVFQAPVADNDDFFELGGNSLLALRLSVGLREAGLPPITMRDMYLHPTIDGTVRLLTGRTEQLPAAPSS